MVEVARDSIVQKHVKLSDDFFRLWLAQLISLFGDSFTSIALLWTVMELKNSPMAVGVTLAISALPAVMIAPVAGAVIDRYSKKKILIITDMVRFVLDLAIIGVIAFGSLKMWHIYVNGICRSAAGVFYRPAYRAMIPQLVAKRELVRANSMQQLSQNIAFTCGPIFAGIAVHKLGAAGAIGIDAVTFLVSALFIALITLKEKIAEDLKTSNTWEQLRSGLSYVQRHNWIVLLTLSCAVVNIGNGLHFVTRPFLIKNVLNLGSDALGYVGSAASAGAVVASLLLMAISIPIRKKIMISLSIFVMSLSIMGMSFTTQLWSLLLVCFVAGLSMPVMVTMLNFIYHVNVPKGYLGRVGVFRTLVASGLMPVSYLVSGAISRAVGTRASLLIAGGVMLMGAVIVLFASSIPEELSKGGGVDM